MTKEIAVSGTVRAMSAGEHAGPPRRAALDTVRTLSDSRHFCSAELTLAGRGQVVLIGEKPAVEQVLRLLEEHGAHPLVELPDDLAEDR